MERLTPGLVAGLELFFKGIEGDIVTLYQTGCAFVTTTSYPHSSHKQTMIHNLFQNGAATLSGTLEAFLELNFISFFIFYSILSFVPNLICQVKKDILFSCRI